MEPPTGNAPVSQLYQSCIILLYYGGIEDFCMHYWNYIQHIRPNTASSELIRPIWRPIAAFYPHGKLI